MSRGSVKINGTNRQLSKENDKAYGQVIQQIGISGMRLV